MSYRDDLIQRLRDVGTWERLAGDEQNRALALTDEEARRILVLTDDFDMGKIEGIAPVAVSSLIDMIASFKTNLVVMDSMNHPKLSKAGMLLAEFIEELQARGIDLGEIGEQFSGFHLGAIAALMVIYGSSD